MPWTPSEIQQRMIDVMRAHPEGITSGQMREEIGIAPREQAQLERRRRELYAHFHIEKRREGKETYYVLKGPRSEPRVSRGVNARARAAVIGRAFGRCQMCGATIADDHIKLVVDHKIPVDWGGPNSEDNLWAICAECADANRPRQHAHRIAIRMKSAADRVLALLGNSLRLPVTRSWISAVACVADGTAVVRRLRKRGIKIGCVRFRRVSYYTLDLIEP